jgi:hypothetical protein
MENICALFCELSEYGKTVRDKNGILFELARNCYHATKFFIDEICTELNSLNVKSILTDTKKKFSTNDVSIQHGIDVLIFYTTLITIF